MVTRSTKIPAVDVAQALLSAGSALGQATKTLRKILANFAPADLPAGAVVDLLYTLRGLSSQLGQLRRPLDEVIDPVIKRIEDHFVETLTVSEATGVQGAAARVQITVSDVPVVKPEDWEEVWRWIVRTKSFDMLPRSLNREAVRERWNAHKHIPKVGVFHAKKVSCTKLNGKGGK